MRQLTGEITASILTSEVIINEKNYPDKLATVRKCCSQLAKTLGMTRADLCENIQVRLNAYLKGSDEPNLALCEFH